MDIWQVLLVALAVYWAGVAWARNSGLLPSFVSTTGPILTLHTKRGRRFIEWASQPKRAWRAWGNFGLGLTAVVLVGVLFALVLSAVATLANPPEPTAVNQPRNTLVIPGVNDFLPLSVAPEIVAGLFIGIVVHEFGHGLMCRVEDIEIKSMGLALLAILPMGAFVEPDQESEQQADRGARARMFAAGVTNNFLVVVLAFGLLFGPVAGAVAVADGGLVGTVYDDSPAAEAGISGGDRVVEVAGTPVENNSEFQRAIEASDERSVAVTLANGDSVTVDRRLFVLGNATESPFAGIATGDTVTTVNGTAVYTEQSLERELENRTIATLETDDGDSVTGPAGAFITVSPDGPAADSGLAAETDAVVVSMAGERVTTGDDLADLIDRLSPGDSVDVVAYVDGERETYDVELGQQADGSAYLGAFIAPGVSGVETSGFGAELYPGQEFLSMLSGNTDDSAYLTAIFGGANNPVTGFLQAVVGALYLPLLGLLDPSVGFNFPGFAGTNTNFFVVTGALGALPESVVFLSANLLLWTGWVNLNLGFFNCIPAFPLDGGHLLRSGAEAITSRLPVGDKHAITRAITTSIGLLMLASLALMLLGPQLLN
ncbi:site-2 protease family protein [Halobacterium litoreum]|uniref:Site-2 protease family protein n=1 Tax=Halobacterium litoreum TaxID=2039234 RepID=A0ABD5NDU0_9EURY|nr:site-2 protease family protein [Halobacterium litoreum]UHH13656.1 site-2 protease family protein [Halobacterium litoreum]